MKLEIYRPVLSNKLTQGFAENKACIYPNGKIVSKYGNVCPSGSRDFYKSIGMKGHNGADLKAYHGEPVFHGGNFDGWMRIEKDRAGGIGVDVISHEELELKDGTKSHVLLRYWHLKAPIGHDGKDVSLGMPIGLADNTGTSSGDHLHFGLKLCDKKGNTKNRGNGFTGGIDITLYLNLQVDAKTHSLLMNIPPKPLEEQEVKEWASHVNLWIRLRNLILELGRLL